MNTRILMVTGLGSGADLARGKKGAFYHTLEELHGYFDRIDIIIPKVSHVETIELFGNVHLHVSSWPLLLHPLFFIKKGMSLIRRHGITLMTVQEFPPFYNGIGAFLLSRLTGVPYVLEVHHVPGYPRAAGFKEWFYRIYTRLFIALDSMPALWVRVVNQTQTKKFLTCSAVPSSKIRYIPSMYIDTEHFRFMGLPKKYDLIFVSRLEKNKNISGLIQAVAILKKQKPDVLLVIVGTGPLEAELKKTVSNLELERNVTFAGWVSNEDHVRLLNESRVFVNPSFNEGGPRSVVEAMACGLPVITTKVGLMPDIIEEGKNGFFCGWNPEDMARVMGKVLETGALENIGKQAHLTASQFKKKDTVRAYAAALQRADQKRLLVITQKVDQHDQPLGFFIEWLRRLGNELICSVLCLETGTYHLKDVSVTSMGKEKGNSRLARLWNFYSYIFNHHDAYDAVFVHMNPIWVVVGGWYWRLRGKKIILWYTHKSVTWKLRVASWFAHTILTASAESFRLPSSKLIVTGHGIDTELFRPPEHKESSEIIRIITVGRITPVKNYEVLLGAATMLRDRGIHFHITVVGEPTLQSDKKYYDTLTRTVSASGLESYVTFIGRVEHGALPIEYGKHDLFVHMSNTGSLDKTILEAMSCGLNVLSSNDAARGFLSPERIFNRNDASELAEKIQAQSGRPPSPELREYVITHHNLDNLIRKIASVVSA